VTAWRCRLSHTEITGNDLINCDWRRRLAGGAWRRWRLLDVVRVDKLLDDGRVVTTTRTRSSSGSLIRSLRYKRVRHWARFLIIDCIPILGWGGRTSSSAAGLT